MNNIKEIAKTIKQAKSIAIFTHISPDFDALGSAFALYYTFRKLGKKADVYIKEDLTSRQQLLFKDITNHKSCKESDYDLFICVDVSSLNRLGEYASIFENSKNNTMVIDHHVSNDNFCKYNYINHERSSCCEIILEVLKSLKFKLNNEIASYLYAGLSSDTSSFQNSGTKINCHMAAIELMKFGADIHKVNEILYETRTTKEIAFKKYLWNNFKTQKDVAFCLVDYKTLSELKGKKADCDSYSRSLVSIEGVNIGFSLIELKEGLFNLSMRSKTGYDVRVIAEKVGGGGHTCAAGAKFEAKNIQTAKKMVLNAIFDREN